MRIRPFYTFIAILILGTCVFTSGFSAKLIIPGSNHYDSKHIESVGSVFKLEGSTASVGTGTYIGHRQILTAAHIFYGILPSSIPLKSGPVTIDIASKRVFWSNEEVLNFSTLSSPIYHASKITVDACFINNFENNIHDPDHNDVKCDMAILTLDKDVPNLKPIAIPDLKPEIPIEGLLVGYGRNTSPHHVKHARAQLLHGLVDMGDWGIFISNLNEDINNNPLQGISEEDTKLELLLGKDKLGNEDTKIVRATQGDSGGPLLVANENDSIQIIGVMSANSQLFNAFASLIIQTPEGLTRNPALDALIRAGKAKG